MPRKAAAQTAAHGSHAAAALAPDRVEEALQEFRRLNSREARAAFADYWIGVWAQDFEFAWSMVYELLNLVNEEELFRDPRRVGPSAPGAPEAHGAKNSYASFAEYFEDRVKRPFERWAELEGTYRYVSNYAPELRVVPYGEARNKAIGTHGGDRKSQQFQGDNSTLKSGRGTSADYTVARLRRDDPRLADAVERGELSANQAAIRAGFRRRTGTVRLDDPDSAARTLRKFMPPEARLRLAELLTREEDQCD